MRAFPSRVARATMDPPRLRPGRADRGGAAADVDWRTRRELAALPAKDRYVPLDHVLDQDRLAVAREGDPLRPMTDRRFGDLLERVAVDGKKDELAVLMIKDIGLRFGRAVLAADREIPAVGREFEPFGRAHHGEGLDRA